MKTNCKNGTLSEITIDVVDKVLKKSFNACNKGYYWEEDAIGDLEEAIENKQVNILSIEDVLSFIEYTLRKNGNLDVVDIFKNNMCNLLNYHD